MRTLVAVVVVCALMAPAGTQAEEVETGFVRHPFTGIVSPDPVRTRYWLEPDQPVVMLGYRWHGLKVEGAISAVPIDTLRHPVKRTPARRDSRSIRLSFKPSPDWTVALSGRSAMGLDQVIPDGAIKRSLLSTTHTRAFDSGSWQTTVGWGRSTRKFGEPVRGFLAESLIRFDGRNVLFSRLEQVGSDELPRFDDTLQQGNFFKVNRLTIGYFQEFASSGAVRADVGAMASRYFVPAAREGQYGSRPVVFLFFLRLRMQ